MCLRFPTSCSSKEILYRREKKQEARRWWQEWLYQPQVVAVLLAVASVAIVVAIAIGHKNHYNSCQRSVAIVINIIVRVVALVIIMIIRRPWGACWMVSVDGEG